jgi:hypothetical protein
LSNQILVVAKLFLLSSLIEAKTKEKLLGWFSRGIGGFLAALGRLGFGCVFWSFLLLFGAA